MINTIGTNLDEVLFDYNYCFNFQLEFKTRILLIFLNYGMFDLAY